MTRPPPPRSALSEPENFIAETRLRRLLRRYAVPAWAAFAVCLLAAGTWFLVAKPQPDRARPVPSAGLPNLRPPLPPSPLPQSKDDLQAPARTAEARGIVEATGPRPERVVDLPAPVPAPEIPAPDLKPAGETGSVDPSPASDPAPAEAPANPDTSKQSGAAAGSEPGGSPETGKAARAELPGANEAIKKADRYLGRGQFTIARYIYEEAYKSGDVLGALGLARSYDAAYLKSIGLRVGGNTQKSAYWYRRAAEMSVRP